VQAFRKEKKRKKKEQKKLQHKAMAESKRERSQNRKDVKAKLGFGELIKTLKPRTNVLDW
jgi:hypothetical protein